MSKSPRPVQIAAALYASRKASATELELTRLENAFILLCPLLIRDLAQKVIKCDQVSEDQLQAASVGCLLALRSYNPDRANFTTWAFQYVRQQLYRMNEELIDLPEYMRCLLRKYDKFRASYALTHDHAPSDNDTCAALGIHPRTLRNVRAAQKRVVMPENDTLDQCSPTADFAGESDLQLDVNRALNMLAVINPRAALAFRLHTYEQLTYEEIGSQYLCVTVARVQQLMIVAVEYIKREITDVQ